MKLPARRSLRRKCRELHPQGRVDRNFVPGDCPVAMRRSRGHKRGDCDNEGERQ